MITKLLVANRGEIARRVFATCRRLGIGTVAVYTDPDADAPHVAEADTRVRLEKINGYLDIGALLAAAKAAGADAVHPGYGFLSENAEFATAVQVSGLTWIGPPAEAVRAMGSKIESKKMMAAAGVPVLDELDPETVTADQLPVLVKASAGGGGRGMRVVTALADLPKAVEAARREAKSAFGDPTVFCERYLPTGHHVEVQVMADSHGTVWAVGERECSIQRRHQKIIEEAPSPLVERVPGMRARLFDAARVATEAIGYTGAGTVEFLADNKGEFFFLEMNTRLQVEHPVTEATTGLDLVELQLQVADGVALGGEPPAAHGHSIEARLYAEDPAKNWQPQAGIVHHFEVPTARSEFESSGRTEVRLDSGIVDGSVVSIHYDPMLAKVISYAPTRRHAALLLADALGRTRLHGIADQPRPVGQRAATSGVPRRCDRHRVLRYPRPGRSWPPRWPTMRPCGCRRSRPPSQKPKATAAAATVFAGLPSGWRNLASGNQAKSYRSPDNTEHRVEYRFTRDGVVLPDDDGVRLVSATPAQVVLADAAGAETTYDVSRYGDAVFVDSPAGGVGFTVMPRFVEPGSAVAKGSLVAPMPGLVIRVGAQLGETVKTGQPLVWLEAMKMEHTITASADGVLTELNVTSGQQVEVGAVLARVEDQTPAEGES